MKIIMAKMLRIIHAMRRKTSQRPCVCVLLFLRSVFEVACSGAVERFIRMLLCGYQIYSSHGTVVHGCVSLLRFLIASISSWLSSYRFLPQSFLMSLCQLV